MTAGPERAAARIEGFLDGSREQPTVRAMLLEAQSLPVITELVQQRNSDAAADLSSDLRGFTPHPKETARLLVSATVEVAMQELSAGRRLQRLRSALLDLIPKKKSAQA
ncbi:MAG: hypothetical protein WEA11_09145 [Acidimicrobiales bacterium]